MRTLRHLANAPIREAILDIQFTEPVSLESLDAFAKAVPDQVKPTEDIWQTLFEVKVGLDLGATHNGVRVGKTVSLDDGKHVLSLRTGGFSLSRLQPYQTFDELYARARGLWLQFIEQVRPKKISRIAVRYTNGLQIPLPILDFKDYIFGAPDIPENLPQMVNGYTSRVNIPWENSADACNITQLIEGGDHEMLNFLFDIDVYTRCELATTDLVSIDSAFANLRKKKNDVFYSYVTEKTLERYQ